MKKKLLLLLVSFSALAQNNIQLHLVTELDNKAQSLANGIYILKLQSENGQVSNQKLIKK